MQYPEVTSATVEQAWPEPGSLKSRGGHHLEPQGSRAYSSAVPRVIFANRANGIATAQAFSWQRRPKPAIVCNVY